jgi:large subunit ribosomal protein L22
MSDTKLNIKAAAKGVRISPRKVNIVASLVRRRSASDALTILQNTPRRAALPLTKVIKSAVANAQSTKGLKLEELTIQSLLVTEGGSFKRFKFVGQGRRARPRPMLKKSSHITVTLAKIEAPAKAAAKSSPKPSSKDAPKKDIKKEQPVSTAAKKKPSGGTK